MTTPAASFVTTSTNAPPAKPAAQWEDLVDIFTQPSAVFARRRDGRFWLPMLVYTLVGALAFFAARPSMQPMFDRQAQVQAAKIDANPQIPAEQKEAIKNRFRNIGDSPFTAASVIVVLPLTLVLSALALWLVGKGFGSGASYGQALAVTSIAGIPRAVLGLLAGAVSAVLGRQVTFPYQLTLGPGTIAGPNVPPLVGALLQRLDVGVLWHTALLGIGLSLMGRVVRRADGPAVEGQIARPSGLAAAFIVWALATALTAWQVFAQNM